MNTLADWQQQLLPLRAHLVDAEDHGDLVQAGIDRLKIDDLLDHVPQQRQP